MRPRWGHTLDVAGKVLISAGLFLLLFTGYQLWGTGISEFRAQNTLEKTFEARRAPTPQYSIPKTGDVAGRITIKSIGLSKMMVLGVDYENLERGPGIFPGAPLPGHSGNLAIAGHRTTFGAPFARINELQIGDSIEIETAEGTYTYIVTSSPRVVPATAVEVAQTLDPSKTSLTLITCHPKWSSKDRLIVEANIDASPVAKTVATYPSTNDSTPQLTRGWFDDSSAWPNVLGLIGLLVALFVMTQFLARRYRYTWLIYTVALLAFLPSLLLLFSQISRLLPNNF